MVAVVAVVVVECIGSGGRLCLSGWWMAVYLMRLVVVKSIRGSCSCW